MSGMPAINLVRYLSFVFRGLCHYTLKQAPRHSMYLLALLSVRKALSRISADICEGRPIEEYKKLFSAFVERVDVFEDYVTIVLKVFDMINVRVCNGSGVIKEEPPLDLHQMVVWNGGADGNRTHVRKQLGKNFSGRRQLFTFPRLHGNCHPYSLSSFIMHGALKALRTHGLHSDHTLARLVDLPGRMGA